MEKEQLLKRLDKSKEKLEKLKIRVQRIEEEQNYQDFETFDFWKRNIDRDLHLIEEVIAFSELDLERTLALVDAGWYGKEDAEYYAEKDMDGVIQKVTGKFNEINKMLKEAVN